MRVKQSKSRRPTPWTHQGKTRLRGRPPLAPTSRSEKLSRHPARRDLTLKTDVCITGYVISGPQKENARQAMTVPKLTPIPKRKPGRCAVDLGRAVGTEEGSRHQRVAAKVNSEQIRSRNEDEERREAIPETEKKTEVAPHPVRSHMRILLKQEEVPQCTPDALDLPTIRIGQT